MPIREGSLRRSDLPSEEELRRELVAEFQDPHDTGEPEIIIQRPTPGSIHLYVLWSRWRDLEQIVRSRIILDAFEESRGADEAIQVTVSMGLTPDEARKLGVG